MAQWYCQFQSGVVGPLSWDELQRRADEGDISPETFVRDGADGPWQVASRVEGLLLVPSGPMGDLPFEEPADGFDGQSAALAQRPATDPARAAARSPLALRPCSDCGTMVSHHAAACPKCGRSFHDASLTLPYQGEQPVPVWVFFTLLAIGFALASPVAVQRFALHAATTTMADATAAGVIALLVAALYAMSMIACALLGGAVGKPRMAYWTGLLLGLFFGPLGVFAAFAIDKRPQCPNCLSRLGGLARECPYCHAHLIWAKEVRWY